MMSSSTIWSAFARTRDRLLGIDRMLLAILAVAIVLRSWHLGWSLPELYEEAYPFAIAWKFWRFGAPGISLNPDFFHYPALTFYVQFLLQAVHYAAGHLAGRYADLAAFQKAYEQDPTIFIGLARSASTLFDAGSVALVYVIARRWFGREAALLAAAAAALSPLLISQSQLVGVDSPMTFFVLAAVACMTRLVDAPAWRWYLAAGLSIGLAAASKYNGALLVLPLVAAHLGRSKETPVSWLFPAAGLALAGAVFFLLNPYILLRPEQFFADFSYEQRHMASGHLGLDAGTSTPAFYLLDALPRLLGWPMLAAAAAGTILGALRRDRGMLLVALFPVVYLAVIGSWEMRAERYLLPVVPFLLVIGSAAAVEAVGLLRARVAPRLLALATATAVLLLLMPPAVATWTYHRSMSLPDTRTVAKGWILGYLPAGGTLATGPFGIRFPAETFTTILIPFSPTGSEVLGPFYDPRWYEDLDLLVASDYDYARFAREPERYRDILDRYARLRSTWTLTAEFAPAPLQNGPTVWLYRPGIQPAETFDESLFEGLRSIAETTMVLRFEENLASALFVKGRYAKCAQLAEASLALAPNQTRLVNTFAWTLYRMKRYPEALAMADRSLSAIPGAADMLALRGSSRLRVGDDRNGERDLQEAITKGAKTEIPYLDLEWLYRRRNDRESQVITLRRYLATLAPGSANALRTQEYLRQLTGK